MSELIEEITPRKEYTQNPKLNALHANKVSVSKMEASFFNDTGITLSQYLILELIVYREIDTPLRISQILEIDRASVSRTVARMVKDGLLVRQYSPYDGRMRVLVPTSLGTATYAKVNAASLESDKP